MFTTFPYTTNYNIKKINNSTSGDYVIELPFNAFKEQNLNYYIYLYIIDDLLGDSSIDEYIKNAISLIDEVDQDNSSSKDSIYKNNSGLTCGVHYFWSQDLFNHYGKNILDKEGIKNYENYYIEQSNIYSDPIYLTDDELYNKDIKHFYNINNYQKSISEHLFDENALLNFASTFFSEVLKWTSLDFNDPLILASNKYNFLYYTVMNYFINNKSDKTSQTLKIILSNTLTNNLTSTSSSCNCSSQNTNSTSLTTSCSDQYSSAMKNWISTMMSDINNYYYNWFYTESINDKGKTCYKPNSDLINNLLELIKEFKDLDLNLSFSTTGNFHHCNCSSNNSSDTSVCNYKIIDNFEQVLNWFLTGENLDHQNTIKAYGKSFGELLFKLYF